MTDTKYIMVRTEVLCPNCMKKKVLQETADRAYCDNCGQGYIKPENTNVLKFE